MTSYLWSGKDSLGQEITERVTASSPEEARDQLLARGWTDLKLQSSEIHEFAKQQVESVSNPEYKQHLTPKQEAALIKGEAPGFWANWWKSVRESAGTFVILILAFATTVYRHRWVGMLICGGLLVVMAVLFPVLHFWFGRPGDLFRKLHQARNWRRWKEVLELLEALKRAQGSRKIGIGAVEMARYRALALAGSGKLDEALDQFSKADGTANMPPWLFRCHLAMIYTVAEQYEKALDCYREAFEVATEKGIVSIDYGSYLVQRFNRPAEARQLLKLAESSPVPEQAKSHIASLRGVIAMREGDFVAAQKHLTEALAGLEKQPKSKYFAYEPSILLAQGHLAVIYAALGQPEMAKTYFAKAEKYLAVIRMDELINEYRSRITACTSGHQTIPTAS